MDTKIISPQQKKPASNFGVDFSIALFLTIILNVLFGVLGRLRITPMAPLILGPAILVFIYRLMKNRVVSWGAITIACIGIVFIWFIQGLGVALQGM